MPRDNEFLVVGECAHCGWERPLTDDHVPPKLLYSPPRPSNLITVPACRDCNFGASHDDEYFRLVCSARAEAAGNPHARDAWETSLRGLGRNESAGFRQRFLGDVRRVWRPQEESGLVISEITGFEVDLLRLDRVATRIVTGLFFHHNNRRPADGYGAAAWTLDAVQETPGWDASANIARGVLQEEARAVGREEVSHTVTSALMTKTRMSQPGCSSFLGRRSS